jgi:hypothetical protein
MPPYGFGDVVSVGADSISARFCGGIWNAPYGWEINFLKSIAKSVQIVYNEENSQYERNMK